MISRIIVSLAAVAASVGFLLYGMGDSYSPKNDGLKDWGLILTAAGLVALGVGIAWYRKVEEADEKAVAAEVARRAKKA